MEHHDFLINHAEAIYTTQSRSLVVFKKPNITVNDTCTEVQTGSHCARILNQVSAIGTEVDDIQINLILTPMDYGSCLLGHYKSGNW